MTHKQVIISFMLLTALPGWIKGEGTRELQPNPAEILYLLPSKDITGYKSFATNIPECDERYKLWVSIGEIGEKILFGFKLADGTTNVNVGIYHSSGTVLFSPTTIPSSGTGFIQDWDHAVAGPSTINPSGYTPFQASPNALGDYYIEFTWTGVGTKSIELFDITVVSSANIEIQGRLWSKNWQFWTPSTGWGTNTKYGKFEGKMYPYTDDQITTEIDFNGMAPARFTVACNPTGCSNTGDFLVDRKSVQGNFTYPAYRIFVNNPDETLFPTGIVGGVDSVHMNNPCDGTVDIDMYVNKQGMAEIVLDINPLPGIQNEDVVLNDTVYSGNATTIHWNGLNGLGELVPNGSTFNIIVTYINGLTHLPMYDVEYSFTNENSWDGFIVNLIRPIGDKPLVFWDDTDPSLLYPGGANLVGCNLARGCHFWGDINSDQGNNATFNTWWFAVSTTLVPITIQYRRSETIPYNYILCEGDSVNVFGNWVNQPGVFSNTLTNFMGCDSISEVTVTVKPGPVIELGDDQVLC